MLATRRRVQGRDRMSVVRGGADRDGPVAPWRPPIGILVGVVAVVLGACAGLEHTATDARSDEADTTPPASTAVELCRGAGQQKAETIANVQAIDAVYRTRAADMAAWRASGAPDDPTPWRDRPDDQLVAVCIFDAVDIQAPAGPALEEGEERPPYDKLTVGAVKDGTARLLQAIRTNWPPSKTYTPDQHAPPDSERVQ